MNSYRSRVRVIAGRIVPGIAEVHAQTRPWAQAWQRANAAALQAPGPLWVALGDSLTQGIGAETYLGGWVGQIQQRMAEDGRPIQVVNLSVTGAVIADLLREQIPRMSALARIPDVITVLAGSNDMNHRSTQNHAPARFQRLLDAIPEGPRLIVATLPRPNRASRRINAVIEAEASRGRLTIAETRGMRLRDLPGTLARDFFHLNERGYSRIADAFAVALDQPCEDSSQ